MVAFDGPGGAGKSTLARALAEQSTLISIVQVDDFYAPMVESERETLTAEQGYEKYFDWVRMQEQLLLPLSKRHRARYQRYDWGHNQLAEWVERSAMGIVLVEGVYSFRPQLREFYDFSVFVDTPQSECIDRLIQRGDSRDWIRRWRAAEDYYLTNFNPAELVSVVIPGS